MRHYRIEDRIKAPIPAKFFIGVMLAGDRYHEEAEREISARYGPLQDHSERYDFSAFSSYYDGEMGGRVWKYFLTLERLLPPDSLVDLKILTEEVQREFAVRSPTGDRRTVNLDPGYLTGWSLVLSTVKNHAHRLYLGQGIYGEVTLVFKRDRFEPLPWTYPDYSSASVVDFFARVRSDYLEQLRNRAAPASSVSTGKDSPTACE